MKKVNILWPTIISCFITSATALIIPGGTDGYMVYYGFPIPFLCIRNELTLNPNEILLSRIGIDVLSFFLNLVIYAVLISFTIWEYKNIKKKRETTRDL